MRTKLWVEYDIQEKIEYFPEFFHFIFQHPWSTFKWWRFCDPSSVGHRPKITQNSTPKASLRHASKLQNQGSHQSNTSRKKNRLFRNSCISLQGWCLTDASDQRCLCPCHPRTPETCFWGSHFWYYQSKQELFIYYSFMVRRMIKIIKFFASKYNDIIIFGKMAI